MSEIAFASMAATLAAKGTEKGTEFLDQARLFMKERWSQSFGQYDIEKVFWQTVYAEGLYIGASVLWRIVSGLTDLFSQILMPLTAEPYSEIDISQQLARQRHWYFGRWCEVRSNEPCTEEGFNEHLKVRHPELYSYKIGGGQEGEIFAPTNFGGLTSILDKVLIDWFNWITLCIPAGFAILEYRHYKKMKRMMP